MPDYPKHLSGFSYVGRHRYSLTFCTFQRRALFTDAAIVNLAWEAFLRAGHDQTMAIIAACFMPDHVHVVAEGRSQGSDALAFISSAKQGSGYRYAQQNEGRRLWQRYGFERVLRDEESTQAVVRYVRENPVRKGSSRIRRSIRSSGRRSTRSRS